MDFNNYDNDTEEELYPHQSKTTKRIKYTFRYILYGLSLIVWVAIMYAVFSTNDPGMFDEMYFSESARAEAAKNPEAFTVYQVSPVDYMNELGTVQIKNIYYAADAEELEVGVQFNLNKISGGKLDNSLVYILTDSEGNYYKAVNIETDSNRRYGYARVSFAGVKLSLKENIYYDYTQSYDSKNHYYTLLESRTAAGTSDGSSVSGETVDAGVVYTVSLYSYDKIMEKGYATVENGIVNLDYERFLKDPVDPIEKQKIYNNTTVFTTVKYDY